MDRELIREWNKIFNHVWDTQPENINLAKLLEIHNNIKREEKCTTTN
jgi:hypothetical protein